VEDAHDISEEIRRGAGYLLKSSARQGYLMGLAYWLSNRDTASAWSLCRGDWEEEGVYLGFLPGTIGVFEVEATHSRARGG